MAISSYKKPVLWITCLCLCGSLAPPSRVYASTLDDDFSFASGLIEWGFSDFALKLSESLLAAHPETAERVNLIRAQSLIASRKFSEAEAMLTQLPAGNAKADAIRLALANAYYATGDMEKARAIYNDFFNRFPEKPTDTDVLRFYRDAAYRYAVMLERGGDLPGALKAYERVLKTDPERDVQRRIMTDQSQILLKLAQANHEGKRDEFAHRTRKLVEDIQWGGVDLWFGQSIITLANVELIYNDEEKAQKIIKDYMDILTQIDGLLEESNMPKGLSPMAGARHLSGQISQRSAERAVTQNNREEALKHYAAALTEFYNVFVQYGESDVAPDSGVRAQAIKDILVNDFGRRVNIDLGDRVNEAATTVFRLGDTLFRERKYGEAAEAYVRALNQFPEAPITMRAMANLIMCYAHQDDSLMVRAIASYVGERLSRYPEAANALLVAGKHYVDKNRPEIYLELYETYLTHFPQHERAGTILFFLATQRRKAGDEGGAAVYLRRIIEDYPQDQYYPRALNQVAWSFYQAGDFESAITYFRRLIKETSPSPDRAQAQFNLADSFIRLGQFTEAAAELETLIGWIAPRNNPYATTPADQQRIVDLLERASFQRAQALARITEPADRIPEFREQAIRAFDLFVRTFAQSELASRALSAKGTVLLELRRFEEATKTFDELAINYPDSPEGKNALFSLARAAMEIKQFDQGIEAFERMMRETDRFQADEFVRLGLMMGEAGYAKEAIRAFQETQRKISALPQERQDASRPLIERSLFGIAQAFYRAEQYNEAIQAAEDLLTRFPQSGLFYDAKFLQGEAYREAGRHQEAVAALSDVFRFAQDSDLINRATLTLAEVQRRHGDLVEALASYQRLALLTDRTRADLRPLIEDSLLASIEIAGQLERHGVVIENADEYLQMFPQGRYLETVRRARADAILKSAASP